MLKDHLAGEPMLAHRTRESLDGIRRHGVFPTAFAPGHVKRFFVAPHVLVIEIRVFVHVHGELELSPARSLIDQNLTTFELRFVPVRNSAYTPNRSVACQ